MEENSSLSYVGYNSAGVVFTSIPLGRKKSSLIFDNHFVITTELEIIDATDHPNISVPGN